MHVIRVSDEAYSAIAQQRDSLKGKRVSLHVALDTMIEGYVRAVQFHEAIDAAFADGDFDRASMKVSTEATVSIDGTPLSMFQANAIAVRMDAVLGNGTRIVVIRLSDGAILSSQDAEL